MFALCLNTSTIRPRPLPEKIEVAARAGYDLIELWSEDVEAYLASGASLASLRARLRDAGLRVPSMIALHGWAEAEDAEFRHARRAVRQRLEMAAALDCPRMVATPPVSRAMDLATVGERYASLLELGRRVGVRPMMEFLGFAVQVNSIRTCLEVLAYADDPEASLVLDPFHIFRGGGSFEDVRLLPGHLVGICHLDDAPAGKPREEQGDADRVPPGDGVLPLVEMVRSLSAQGYRGPLSLELFHPELWRRDPLEVAADGQRRMREILRRAGC